MGLVRSILLAGGGGPGGAFHYLWDGRVIFPRSRATDRGSYTKDGLKSSFEQKPFGKQSKSCMKVLQRSGAIAYDL